MYRATETQVQLASVVKSCTLGFPLDTCLRAEPKENRS